MDEVERQELLNSLEEIKQLVDEAFPLESSVVRDQVLSMLIATTIQAKIMARQVPPPVVPDFMGMATGLKDALESADKTVAASLTTAASRMVQEEDKLSSEAAQGWAWEAYEYFFRMLKVA